MTVIAVSARTGEARIAVLQAGDLVEYAIWRFDRPGDIGDVFAARLDTRFPAMAGGFADIGGMAGFLPDSAGASQLTEGAYFEAEITRCAQGGKGPRLALLRKNAGGRTGLLRQGFGPLADFAARFPSAPVHIDDHALIATLNARLKAFPHPALSGRLGFERDAFHPVLEEEVAGLAEPVASLPGGARMHITPTPALTAIDIDAAAAATSNNVPKPRAQLEMNVALIPEIARQILLRNLSGAILLDFAGMKSAARPKLLPSLEAALKSDPLHPKCLGFTNTGFAEIVRARIRPPLYELLE